MEEKHTPHKEGGEWDTKAQLEKERPVDGVTVALTPCKDHSLVSAS